MKLLYIHLLSCATVVLSQSIAIGTPSEGQTLHVGKPFKVMVERPNTLTGSAEVGIAIALHHCARSPCEDASEVLGSLLYNGAYNPQLLIEQPALQPHQNFTVTIPEWFSTGPAVLSVPHSTLIGAGPFFFSEIVNFTINVVA